MIAVAKQQPLFTNVSVESNEESCIQNGNNHGSI